MNDAQIAKLAKEYERLRNKKLDPLSPAVTKMYNMIHKLPKETLVKLVGKNIPFVSTSAVTTLIIKHGMGGDEIKKHMNEEVELDENGTSDYHYDGEVIHISKKNFNKIHKNYKGGTKSAPRMLVYDKKRNGTVSALVKFTEETIHEETLDEAKSPAEQIKDLEKLLDKYHGNTSAVKMKRYAWQKKINKLKKGMKEETMTTNSGVAGVGKDGPADWKKPIMLKRRKNLVTKHYIEVNGKFKKREK